MKLLRPRGRTIGTRAYWLRVAGMFAIAQILGYLASIESRDRLSQDVCFFVIYVVLLVSEETLAHIRARRAATRTRRPGS